MQFTVRALRHGGYRYGEWVSSLVEQTTQHVLLRREQMDSRGASTTLLELFPLGHWFYVTVEIRAGLPAYTCKVITPVEVRGSLVEFVDLDLCFAGDSRRNWQMCDYKAFEESSRKYNYPEELLYRAKHELTQLRDRADKGGFPFNGFFNSHIK